MNTPHSHLQVSAQLGKIILMGYPVLASAEIIKNKTKQNKTDNGAHLTYKEALPHQRAMLG